MDLGRKNLYRLDGMDLCYYRTGSGEPMLLVHGITTYSFIWRRMVPLLKDCFDVITVDLPGCGDSGKALQAPYSIANHASWLNQLLDDLDIDRFHFVGHDIGGGIGQRYAVTYPERLFSLTVMNTVGYDYWPVQPIIAMRTPILRQLAMAALDVHTLKLIIKRGIHNRERCTPELMELFWKPLSSREGRKAFLHFAKSLNNNDLMEIEDRLKALTLPVLIIRGQGDPFLSEEISKRLNRDIKNSRLEYIPAASHFIQEDQPEHIARLIKEFIDNR